MAGLERPKENWITDDMSASQFFDPTAVVIELKVGRNDGGSYTAVCEAFPDLTAVSDTEHNAIQCLAEKVADRLNGHITEGSYRKQ